MNIDISFVVIGLNESKHLARCFESISMATAQFKKSVNYEIIYVDSGSNDNSIEIARKFTENIVELQPVATPPSARNAGIIKSQGEFIQFLDGDMEISPFWVIKSYDLMKLLDDCGVAGIIGIRTDYIYTKDERMVIIENFYGVKQIRIANHFGGAFFAKKEIVVNAGLYNPDLHRGAEPELHARLLHYGYKVIEIPQLMIVHYNDNKASEYDKINRCIKVHIFEGAFAKAFYVSLKKGHLNEFLHLEKLSSTIFFVDIISIGLMLHSFIYFCITQIILLIYLLSKKNLKYFLISRTHWIGVIIYLIKKLYSHSIHFLKFSRNTRNLQ